MAHFNDSHLIQHNAYFNIIFDAEIDQAFGAWYPRDADSTSASGIHTSPALAVGHTTPFQNRDVSFQEAKDALALLRLERRKGQNRSAQRAYRERVRKRINDLQDTLDDATADRDKLRERVRVLESDINQLQLQNYIQRMRLERPNSAPKLSSRRRLDITALVKEESIGWMLKHIYGLEEADDDAFAVFEVKKSS